MRKILVGLAMLFIALAANSQTQEVTGKITDATGAPIPGTTIIEKGTKNGTVAKDDGSFMLRVGPKATLIISSLGFEVKEVAAAQSVSVMLKTDTRSLSDIVVTGVGTQTSKKKLAFSVESISSDKLPQTPTASVDQALVGKIAGAQISSVSGTPGHAVNILLRGVNTLQSGTSPMILLDGIEVYATNLNTLDLSTIDKIEVVEGAAAASIYGAQGANGVIQLFTKKGARDGKLNFDLSSSVARNSYLNVGNLRKAQLHGFNTDGQNNVVNGSGDALAFNPEYGYEDNLIWNSLDTTTLINKPYNANLKFHDQFKEFFVPANTYNNSIAMSGGTNKFDFLLSVSNNHQESTFKNNGYLNRSNVIANIGGEIFKGLKIRSVTQVAYTRNTINGDQGLIYPLFNSRPFIDYDHKDSMNNYLVYYGDAPGVNGANPNYVQQYTHTNDDKLDVIQNFSINYKPFKYLELDAKYGYNYQKQNVKWVYDNQTQNINSDYWQFWYSNYNGGDATGEFDRYDYTTHYQNFVATATIRTDFEKDFHLKLPITTSTQLAYDFRKSNYNSYAFHGLGQPLSAPFTDAGYSTYVVTSDFTDLFVTYGYLANQRFDVGDYGGFSGGVRSDYSSAFGRGSKPFTFPRGDAYIRPSSFAFWKDSKMADVFTDLKFRAAFGKAGIQPGHYQRYITLNPTPFGSSSVYTNPINSSNPGLNVEVSQELEIGTDMAFRPSRGNWFSTLTFSFTWWKRKTDNAIWNTDVAPSTGLGSIVNNAFGLKSNGLQASLNINMLNSHDFSWNFTTNFSKENSEITSVTGGIPIPVLSSAGSSGYVLQPGYKIGQLFGFLGLHSVDAVDPATNTPYIAKADQGAYTVASNGWVVSKDTKQPYFTSTPYSFGDPNPKFNMSFINDITYKNFLTLSFQFDWINGSHLYNQTKEWMYRDGIHSDYEKPITIDGTTAAYSAFYRGVYAQVSRNGTKNYFYEDASFLRLRNIAVVVDLTTALKMKTVRKVQLVLTGRNLVTFTKYTGMDPEISSGTSNSSFDRGVDHNTMPNLKTFQVGVNFGL